MCLDILIKTFHKNIYIMCLDIIITKMSNLGPNHHLPTVSRLIFTLDHPGVSQRKPTWIAKLQIILAKTIPDGHELPGVSDKGNDLEN